MFGGVLIDTTVTECGLYLILPLFLIIASIVGVGILCTNICPLTDKKCLPVMLNPVDIQYDLCMAAPIM